MNYLFNILGWEAPGSKGTTPLLVGSRTRSGSEYGSPFLSAHFDSRLCVPSGQTWEM